MGNSKRVELLDTDRKASHERRQPAGHFTRFGPTRAGFGLFKLDGVNEQPSCSRHHSVIHSWSMREVSTRWVDHVIEHRLASARGTVHGQLAPQAQAVHVSEGAAEFSRMIDQMLEGTLAPEDLVVPEGFHAEAEALAERLRAPRELDEAGWAAELCRLPA